MTDAPLPPVETARARSRLAYGMGQRHRPFLPPLAGGE